MARLTPEQRAALAAAKEQEKASKARARSRGRQTQLESSGEASGRRTEIWVPLADQPAHRPKREKDTPESGQGEDKDWGWQLALALSYGHMPILGDFAVGFLQGRLLRQALEGIFGGDKDEKAKTLVPPSTQSLRRQTKLVEPGALAGLKREVNIPQWVQWAPQNAPQTGVLPLPPGTPEREKRTGMHPFEPGTKDRPRTRRMVPQQTMVAPAKGRAPPKATMLVPGRGQVPPQKTMLDPAAFQRTQRPPIPVPAGPLNWAPQRDVRGRAPEPLAPQRPQKGFRGRPKTGLAPWRGPRRGLPQRLLPSSEPALESLVGPLPPIPPAGLVRSEPILPRASGPPPTPPQAPPRREEGQGQLKAELMGLRRAIEDLRKAREAKAAHEKPGHEMIPIDQAVYATQARFRGQ